MNKRSERVNIVHTDDVFNSMDLVVDIASIFYMGHGAGKVKKICLSASVICFEDRIARRLSKLIRLGDLV